MGSSGNEKADSGPLFRVRAAWILAFAVAMLAGMAAPAFRGAFQARPLTIYAMLALLSLAGAALAARWLRWRLATTLVVAWTLLLALHAGPLPVVAVVMMLLAAMALGARLHGADGFLAWPLHAVAGLLAIAGLSGWCLALPVHRGWSWALVLLAVFVLDRCRVATAVRAMRRGWSSAVAGAPAIAAIAVLMLGIASTAAWLPDLQADDLAYHQRLPAQLVRDAAYVADPAHMLWAYAPWSSDVLHAIASLVARQEARGALAAAWLALCAALAWQLSTALGGSPRMRWLCALLVGSIPLLGGLATGMNTELPATAATLALLCLAQTPGSGRLRTAAVLAGGLAGLKLMHIYAAVPLLAWIAWQNRASLGPKSIARMLLLFVAVGLSSYILAWLATGNPVLPLFNGVFRSEFAPISNFDDPRWHAGMDLLMPWRLAFDTTRYLENGPAALGFASVGLAGAATLALGQRHFAMPMLVSLLLLLLPLFAIQYARYALPGLACAMVVAATAAESMAGARVAVVLALLVAVANASVLPSGNWLLSTPALRRVVQHGGQDAELEKRFLPAARVLDAIPGDDRSTVLATDPDMPYVARFGRHGRVVNWYDPSLRAAALAADGDPSGRAWSALLRDVGPRWLLTRAEPGPALQAGMRLYGAAPVARCGDAGLWRKGAAGPIEKC